MRVMSGAPMGRATKQGERRADSGESGRHGEGWGSVVTAHARVRRVLPCVRGLGCLSTAEDRSCFPKECLLAIANRKSVKVKTASAFVQCVGFP